MTSPFQDILVSWASSAFSTFTSAPLERVKLILQCQDELLRKRRIFTPHSGAIGTFTRLIRDDGFTSLWKGYSFHFLRFFPNQFITFVHKNRMQELFPPVDSKKNYWKWFLQTTVSGVVAGGISLFYVYPLDVMRTRMAVDVAMNGGRQSVQVVDVVKRIFEYDGIGGFFTGFGISVLGIALYRISYFAMYDFITPLLPNPLFKWLSGWFITITAGILTYPLDTIRRRMMMCAGEAFQYSSSFHALRTIVKEEGALSLWKGAGVNALRGIVGALALVAFDTAVEKFQSKNKKMK